MIDPADALKLGLHIAEALGVPRCGCRYGHDERYGDKDCPRRGFGS